MSCISIQNKNSDNSTKGCLNQMHMRMLVLICKETSINDVWRFLAIFDLLNMSDNNLKHPIFGAFFGPLPILQLDLIYWHSLKQGAQPYGWLTDWFVNAKPKQKMRHFEKSKKKWIFNVMSCKLMIDLVWNLTLAIVIVIL